MARYSTPPPALRPLPPASPRRSDEIQVVLSSIGGENLGTIKVLRITRIIDVKDRLMRCLGGAMGFTFEPHLVAKEQLYTGVN